MEFRLYSLDYAETFAQLHNNPNVLNNGYDKHLIHLQNKMP